MSVSAHVAWDASVVSTFRVPGAAHVLEARCASPRRPGARAASRTVLVRCALVIATVAVPALGHAQPSADDAERALTLHQRGAEALRDARFARARDLFREAMELSPNGGSAYNLALALRGTGESLEAIAILERILSGELGEVDAPRAAEMRRWIVEERGALSTVALSLRGPEVAAVRLDAREVGAVTQREPLTLEINAGRHTLTATAEGYAPFEQTLFADRAAAQRVELSLEPLASGGILEEPAFWIVAASVVLAVVAVSVVAAFAPYEDPPMSYGPFHVATALTLPAP